jgi:hypothetical protein
MRLAIFNHLQAFEMNIELLIDVVVNYRFDLPIEELVEVVRMYDILGAERRREYAI